MASTCWASVDEVSSQAVSGVSVQVPAAGCHTQVGSLTGVLLCAAAICFGAGVVAAVGADASADASSAPVTRGARALPKLTPDRDWPPRVNSMSSGPGVVWM